MSIDISSIAYRYGGSQTDYLKMSAEAVQKGCLLIQEGREAGKDLEPLFFSLMDAMARARKEIAVAHGTKNAYLFGRKKAHLCSDLSFTCLGEANGLGAQYKPYNDRMLIVMQKILKGSIPLKGAPEKKKFRIDDQYEGRKCSFELELVTRKELIEREWDQDQHSQMAEAMSSLKRNPAYLRIDEPDFPSVEEDTALLTEFHGQHRRFKKGFPAVYTHGKMNFALNALNTTFPSPKKFFNPDGTPSHIEGNANNLKSIYLLAKVRIEINGKMYALSEYLTWTYQDYTTDPVDRLKHSAIAIFHQDRYLIDDTLKEIARLFKTALQWDKSKDDMKALKTQVGLIRYLFAHVMPYSRGSAAIGEWLEEAIYRDRGCHFRRIEGKSGDLEAFIAPLYSTFIQNKYSSTIEIS